MYNIFSCDVKRNPKSNPNPNPNPNPNLNPYPTLNKKLNHYPHSNSLLSEISSQEQLSPEQMWDHLIFIVQRKCYKTKCSVLHTVWKAVIYNATSFRKGRLIKKCVLLSCCIFLFHHQGIDIQVLPSLHAASIPVFSARSDHCIHQQHHDAAGWVHCGQEHSLCVRLAQWEEDAQWWRQGIGNKPQVRIL